jgi:hypothetical protein
MFRSRGTPRHILPTRSKLSAVATSGRSVDCKREYLQVRPPAFRHFIYDGHAMSSGHNKLNGCRVLIVEDEIFWRAI